jgi:HEAT repeat protein
MTALVSLSKIDRSLTVDYLESHLRRTMWYDVNRLAVLTAIQNLADKKFLPLVKEHASLKYNYAIRQQALNSWAACAPADPELTDALMTFAKSDILPVQTTALELLGRLKSERALPFLDELVRTNGDGDVRKAARDALDEIRRLKE